MNKRRLVSNKNSNLLSEKILREYVRHSLLLTENDYNDWMSSDDLGDIFITPFVNVFKTAVGKTKEIATRTKTLLWVGLQTVLTTLIPVYGYNYSDVFDREKEEIEKIRGEYKDVYAAVDNTLKSDAALLAFMASPALAVGALAAAKGPKVAKELASATTGGLTDEVYDTVSSAAKKVGRWAVGDDGSSRSSGKRSKSPGDFFETHLREADGDKKPAITPMKLMKSKKFAAAFDNPKTKKMQDEATKIYRASLEEVYKQAENIAKKMKTVEDIEKAVGKKATPEMKAKFAEVKKLPPEEKAKAEKLLIDGSKKGMKEFYVKGLQNTVAAVRKAGIPEDAQFVKDYRAVIAKIKALS